MVAVAVAAAVVVVGGEGGGWIGEEEVEEAIGWEDGRLSLAGLGRLVFFFFFYFPPSRR